MAEVPGLRVRRRADQGLGSGDGWTSRRVFAFGGAYDPTWSGVGPLVALNVERLEPACGFPAHPHAGVVVATLVLAGVLEQEVADGPLLRATAGSVLVLRAGRGTTHVERASADGPASVVSGWLLDAEPDGQPGTSVEQVPAGGVEGAALRCPGARLRRVRLGPGGAVDVPGDPVRSVLVVVDGALETDGSTLHVGDAAVHDGPRLRLRAGRTGADVVLWELA